MMDYNQALKILGLKENFTKEELKKVYRKLTAENHPDKHNGDPKMNEKQLQINEAYSYLSKYADTNHQSKSPSSMVEYVRQKNK